MADPSTSGPADAGPGGPHSPSPSRLEATGLQKRFGARKVVKDVHLAVAGGEVVGLLGPNGAGKTTTFYMVVGLVRADAGRILIDGQEVQGLPIHQRSRMGLSYLPQEASIFRKLTVEENVRAVLELAGYKNVNAKMLAGTNPLNNGRVALEALKTVSRGRE
jgi:lipopolysaccharide export system ATP-binding protein